ncbi:Helix-turn-helix [Loktanella salsilacus]|uniref:Helix-turn-helix n=1 Tax=Loktanella salsilacus TaxID=195913 RepID=A0A1I4CMB8_9RHOB|nr:helix-turn-helix transcriptional regulator [Loktanella salsilacus]SFK82388.1 Helix-turn-helix [Loktanella salsilacus]
MLNDLGLAIRKQRNFLKLTLADLSVKCGLSKPALSEIENGKRDIRITSLLRISSGLGVKMEELLRKDVSKGLSEDEAGDGIDLSEMM